jgi:hypothetical protein
MITNNSIGKYENDLDSPYGKYKLTLKTYEKMLNFIHSQQTAN